MHVARRGAVGCGAVSQERVGLGGVRVVWRQRVAGGSGRVEVIVDVETGEEVKVEESVEGR